MTAVIIPEVQSSVCGKQVQTRCFLFAFPGGRVCPPGGNEKARRWRAFSVIRADQVESRDPILSGNFPVYIIDHITLNGNNSDLGLFRLISNVFCGRVIISL